MPARKVVYLRHTFTVSKLFITDGAEFTTVQPRPLRLCVRNFTEAELSGGYSRHVGGAVDVYWHADAPPKAYEELVKYSRGDLDRVLGDGTRVRPSEGELAGSLQEFGRQAMSGVSDAVQRVVCALRWRLGIGGPHDPLSVRMPEWSEDDVSWKPFPMFFNTVRILESESAPLLSKRAVELAEVAGGLEEPVYHSLFREAWSQRMVNRRSALVIGLAAAEIGVKTTLVDLAPTAEWLILNVPSPPLEQLLRTALPEALKAAGHPVRFDLGAGAGSVLTTLRNGVTQRNACVHRPGPAPDFDKVDRFLLAVRDVLNMCDVYAGHDWAEQRIREETLREWKMTSEGQAR